MIYTNLVIACNIPDSFSNVVYIYNLTIDLVHTRLTFKLAGVESSYSMSKNTFKVVSFESVPLTNMVWMVDSTYGVYLYDLEYMQTLLALDLYNDNLYSD